MQENPNEVVWNEKEALIIAQLNEKGIEDPEVRGAYDQWADEEEGRVSEASDPALALILFNIKKARLMFDAGCIRESYDEFDSAALQAKQEERTLLYSEIIEEMNLKY